MAAMDRLLEGDRFRCRRILADLSELKIPLGLLEVATEGLAARVAGQVERILLPFREVVHSGLENIGLVLLGTSFYDQIASCYPERILEEAELLTVRGRRWWIADLVASRMMRALLISHRPLAIGVLERQCR